MFLLDISQYFLNRTVGINFGGDFLHRLLIAMQVGVSDFEQPVERNVHHLVVQQFLAIIFSANAKVPVGVRQN